MPASQQYFLVCLHDSLYPVDLRAPEATAVLETNRQQPKLGYINFALHMHVGRLVTVTRIKE
jgi:hypothetical protein